jgi:LPS-assembly lipoprotein
MACALLAACGFQLRGSYELPYKSVFISAPTTSQVASSLRRELTNSNIILATAKDAEVILNVSEERRDKQILSLSGAGRVREYTLRTLVRYQLVDGKGAVIIPTSEIQLTRILGYDDTKVIAKQQEETLLYSDMETDVVGQILRRMIAVRRAS